MKSKFVATIMLALAFAAFLAVMPTLAQPGLGPKFDKYVASLELDGDRYGQVIFNTNPEDNGTLEVEVEVEECMDLVNSTVNVYLNSELIGTIDIDEYGNGKDTFYVEAISTDDDITVAGAVILESGEWREWIKGRGPK